MGLNGPLEIIGTFHMRVLTLLPTKSDGCLVYTRETEQVSEAKHMPIFLCHVKKKELNHLNTGKGQSRRFHVYDH